MAFAFSAKLLGIDQSRGARAAAGALAWVEQIAHAFANKIATQHRQEDASARQERLPWIDFQIRIRVVQHTAPSGRRRRYAGAKEAQGGLGENSGAGRH